MNNKQDFKSLVEAFGMNWDKELASDMKIIYDSINAKNQSGEEWKKLKKLAKLD